MSCPKNYLKMSISDWGRFQFYDFYSTNKKFFPKKKIHHWGNHFCRTWNDMLAGLFLLVFMNKLRDPVMDTGNLSPSVIFFWFFILFFQVSINFDKILIEIKGEFKRLKWNGIWKLKWSGNWSAELQGYLKYNAIQST